jgi:hypothetical protein
MLRARSMMFDAQTFGATALPLVVDIARIRLPREPCMPMTAVSEVSLARECSAIPDGHGSPGSASQRAGFPSESRTSGRSPGSIVRVFDSSYGFAAESHLHAIRMTLEFLAATQSCFGTRAQIDEAVEHRGFFVGLLAKRAVVVHMKMGQPLVDGVERGNPSGRSKPPSLAPRRSGSDADVQRRPEADRREVDPPIRVQTATWSTAGQLDWWMKEGQAWWGRVRGTDGRQTMDQSC